MKKRILSILLCFCMTMSLLPMWALAADDPAIAIGSTPLTNGKYYIVSGNVVTELDKAPENGDYLSCTLDGTNITLKVTGDVSYSDSNPVLWITNSTLTLTGSGNLSMTNSGTTPVVSGNSGSLSTDNYTGNLSFISTGSNVITNCEDVTLETTGTLTLSGNSSNATIHCRNNVTLKGSTVSLTNSSGSQLISAGGERVSVSATAGDLRLTGSTPVSPLVIADSGEHGTNGTVALSASGNIFVTNSGIGKAVCGALTASAGGTITLESTSGCVLGGSLTVTKAADVTVTGANNTAPTVSGDTNITADGNVSIKNTGSGMAVGKNLIATSKNGSVTVEGTHASAPAISGTATITAAKDITITSASNSDIGATEGNTLTAGGFVIRSKSTGTTITKDGTPITAVYGGGISTSGLNLATPPKESTVYTAGNGYALFKPASGATPATLTLHSVDISVLNGYALVLPNDSDITIVTEEDNFLQSSNWAISNNNGNITIQGDGTLIAQSSDDGIPDIYCNKAITITGGVSVSAPEIYSISNLIVDTTGTITAPKMTALDTFTYKKGTMAGSWVSEYKGDEHNNATQSIYGNVTLTNNKSMGLNLKDDSLTVTTGATLTINSGVTLTIKDNMSILNNGTIVNNGTISLPTETTAAQITALNLTGSGTLTVGGTTVVVIKGTVYPVSGDVSSSGLNLTTPPTESTVYTAGSGYALFKPASGAIPATLVLHNAVINTASEDPLTLGAETVIKLEGTNSLVNTDDVNRGVGIRARSNSGGFQLVTIQGGSSDSLTVTAWQCTQVGALTVSGGRVTMNGSVYGMATEGNVILQNGAQVSATGGNGGFALQLGMPPQQLDLTIDGGSTLTVGGMALVSGNLTVSGGSALTADGKYFDIGGDMNVTGSGTKLTVNNGSLLGVVGNVTVGSGAVLENNGMVYMKLGTTVEQIKALKLSGSGVVRVSTNEPSPTSPPTWDTYTNDGAAVKEITGDLNLSTGDHSTKTVEKNGYSWNAESSTLTLGNHAYVSGSLTLPTNATVTIKSAPGSIINGTISGDGKAAMKLTFTGTAPLSINGGISGGTNNDTVTVQGGAQVTTGRISLGASGGADGTLNVKGAGTSLTASDPQNSAVYCQTINVQEGASLTANGNSVGVMAMNGNVNVTGGSTLRTNCEYGVYIIGGKLEVDSNSKLITNGSVAPFCIVDKTSKESQSDVLSLSGKPAGTEIKSVKGTTDFSGKNYTYWSLVSTGGSLSVSNENNEPVTLTGANKGLLTFEKASSGGNNNNNNNGGGNNNSGGGGLGGGSSASYTLTFETNGGSNISSVSKASGIAIDLSSYQSTRDGYDFAGWYSDTALTTKVTSVTLTKSTTVYAKWTGKTAQSTNTFVDVADSAYYHDAVLWAVQKNVTSGTSNTAFSPDMICTRAQAVTFLWRAKASPEPTSANCAFTDVSKDAYYYKAVLWAMEKGIVKGTSPTIFSPNDTVTRSQSMTFLWRTAGETTSTSTNPFADVSKEAYYYNAVLWAVEKGITKGTSATAFSPDGGCTRSQIVTFLYRYAGK